MYSDILIAAAILTSIGVVSANRPAVQETQWVPLKPHKIEWSSTGSAEVNDDHSIRFLGSDEWQEFTLVLSLPDEASFQRLRLEVFPPDASQIQSGKELILFDVKPSLENAEKGRTVIDFESCQMLGRQPDPSLAHCIDGLTDTGWSVPRTQGSREAYSLVFELGEPVLLGSDDRLAITLDSGGARNLLTLSRIRISIPAIER